MRARISTSVAMVLVLTSCGGGPPSPPALAYTLPAETSATYLVSDTVTITMEMMGQALSLDAASAATYGARFERAGDGVRVRLEVEDLDAAITVPMAGPVAVDESVVDGALVFTLGRRGDVVVESLPTVSEEGGQLVEPALTAHTFFPALPGTAARAGDTWTDTVSFEQNSAAAVGTQRYVIDYVVAGDTLVDGRALLAIDFTGTSAQEQTLSLQGAQVSQRTTAELEGKVLWDAGAGMMFERDMVAVGNGTVSVQMIPTPLPVRLRIHSRVRLQPR